MDAIQRKQAVCLGSSEQFHRDEHCTCTENTLLPGRKNSWDTPHFILVNLITSIACCIKLLIFSSRNSFFPSSNEYMTLAINKCEKEAGEIQRLGAPTILLKIKDSIFPAWAPTQTSTIQHFWGLTPKFSNMRNMSWWVQHKSPVRLALLKFYYFIDLYFTRSITKADDDSAPLISY